MAAHGAFAWGIMPGSASLWVLAYGARLSPSATALAITTVGPLVVPLMSGSWQVLPQSAEVTMADCGLFTMAI